MNVGGFATISELLNVSDSFVDIDDFWEWLGESEITWGSKHTVVLLEKQEFENYINEWLEDYSSKDSEKIKKIVSEYSQEYVIVEQEQ